MLVALGILKLVKALSEMRFSGGGDLRAIAKSDHIMMRAPGQGDHTNENGQGCIFHSIASGIRDIMTDSPKRVLNYDQSSSFSSERARNSIFPRLATSRKQAWIELEVPRCGGSKRANRTAARLLLCL